MPLTATWTDQEDEALRKLVKEYGPKKWSVIAQKLKTKGSKQCRRRWKNYLNADLKSGGWTAEEDRILMEGHRLYGNKWTEIAKMVGGRTDNAVKNRYAALCKRDMRGGGSVRRAAANGGGAAATGARGGRKARPANSDSDNASDVELDDDSDAEEEAKRSSSFSSDRSHDPSPSRGSKGSRGAAAEGSTRSPPTRGSVGGAVSPRAAAGGSGGARAGSILGPRRRSAAAATTEDSPPPQAEPDEMPPAKRRALMNGGVAAGGTLANGPANGRQLLAPTPRTPRTPRLLAQLQEATLANNIQQHQQHAVVAASRAGAGVGRGLVGSGGKVGAPPKKPPALTINIPNPSAADPMAQPPPTSGGAGYGIEIRVLRDLLTPQEIQYARELNDMQLPLHINVDDEPLMVVGTGLHPPGGVSAGGLPTTAGVLGGGPAGSGLGAGGHGEAPLTTSRQAAHNALNALVSPGSAGGALADFNDVLRWFQTGLTPRSTYGGSAGGLGTLGGTPRNMLGSLGRTGLTPRGLHTSTGRGGHDSDGGGLGLGTGLTPRGLRGGGGSGGGGSPASGSGSGTPPSSERLGPNGGVSAGTPSMRTRRQIAVAAAVAASAGPGPSFTSHAHQHGGPQGAFAGAELHAGHRQLLTKLIQNAAVPSETPKPGAAADGGNTILSARGDLRVVPPPSPGVFSPGGFLATSRGPATRSAAAQQQQAAELQSAGSAGVMVMPQFTQQELLMLLEVLNSDDLQALPPPPEAVA